MSVADRAKHQLGLYWRITSVILLLVGLAAIGSAAYLAMTPGVEDVPPQQVDVQEFRATLEHSAVVQNETSLYTRGNRLRNQPRYTFVATPDLRFSAVADVPDEREVTVSHELVLTFRASADDRSFFERQRTLIDRQETVTDGRFVANSTVNATALRAELNGIQDEVGTLGTTSSQLALVTTYDTESTQGDTYEGTLSSSSSLEFADNGYWVDGNLSAAQEEDTTIGGGQRRLSPNWGLVGVLGTLGAISLVLAGLIAFRWKGRIDLEEIEIRIDRAQYTDWISEGDFPVGEDYQYIYIDSLEGVVDIAIDSNKRVIYDQDIDAYGVVDDELIYYYATDSREVSSWLDIS
jgi:hypothetical protein